MLKFYPKLLLPLLVLLGLCSCHHKVSWEHPHFDYKPTVNSILVVGKPVRVHVSLAIPFSSPASPVVNNANVSLFVDNRFAEVLGYDEEEGYYLSELQVEPAKEYRCEVLVPGYPIASASTRIPIPEKILTIEHINFAGVDEEGCTYPAIKLSFSSKPEVLTFYEVSVKLMEHEDYFMSPMLVNIIDPVLLSEGLPILTFSNQEILGSTYTMTINYKTSGAGSINGETYVTTLYPFILELRTVSYDYYLYTKSLHLYEESNSNTSLSGSTIVPFPLHSNVENGFGIFAGYSGVITDTIKPTYNY